VLNIGWNLCGIVVAVSIFMAQHFKENINFLKFVNKFIEGLGPLLEKYIGVMKRGSSITAPKRNK
jgi:hypothetical protein